MTTDPWETHELGELFRSHRTPGRRGLPVYSVTMQGLIQRDTLERRVESRLGAAQHLLVNRGDLVYNMMRMWQGVCGVATRDCLVSPAYVVCRPDKRICPEYARHLCRWEPLVQTFLSRSQGVAADRFRLYYDQFRRIRVDLPPLPEQRRIAEILDTLDEAIRKTEQVIAKLQKTKQGLLHDLLTRGIDESGALRDPESHPEQFQDSPLGRIPKEWAVRQVREAGSVQLGRQRSPQHEKGLHVRPYLRVANVFDGWIDFSNVLSMNFTPREQETYSVLPGDVLLNEGQSLELVGRSALYDGQPSQYCFQNTLVRFRCVEGVAIARFAQAVFKHWLDTGAFTRIAKQTTSVAHLGADRFAKMPMPLPPTTEQSAISKALDVFDKREALERQGVAKLRSVKYGLMHDLLTGRVRVRIPQKATR